MTLLLIMMSVALIFEVMQLIPHLKSKEKNFENNQSKIW